MIVIQFFGGIGNQMFQYALGRHLSLKYNRPIFFNKAIYEENRSNRTFDLEIFKLGANIIDDPAPLNLRLAKIKRWTLSETSYLFDKDVLNVLENETDPHILLLISGYWQSYKYFQSIESILKGDFTFINSVTGKWRQMMGKIQTANSVMVNVRRGDYLEKDKLAVHGVVSKAYIEAGMEICRSSVDNPIFFIFSDGMDWCKKNIRAAADTIFVDETYYDDKFQFYLQLMISCKYFIISNSTFAWWAAWLSGHKEKIVICPEKWFLSTALDPRDLLPDEWIKL